MLILHVPARKARRRRGRATSAAEHGTPRGPAGDAVGDLASSMPGNEYNIAGCQNGEREKRGD